MCPSAVFGLRVRPPAGAEGQRLPDVIAVIPKALLADSLGDSQIVAGLIQDGMEDLRHAISGQIARGLFG